MKRGPLATILWCWTGIIVVSFLVSMALLPSRPHPCWTGAFLKDQPAAQDIKHFKTQFGKKPYLVMIFLAWNHYPAAEVIRDVYDENCALFVTWEPWVAETEAGIDYDALIAGKDDAYITEFAGRLKAIGKPVFLRFGHEPNGDWYPWSGHHIGKEKYLAMYRHVKDVFDRLEVKNVQWVFTINWQNIPRRGNDWRMYYPGDAYTDFIGIDGYNWGNVQTWSNWKSFSSIFGGRLREIRQLCGKPVILSELASAKQGGNRARWIRNAMAEIRRRSEISGFVLFNVDKETDWRLEASSDDGKQLKEELKDVSFKEHY